MIGNSDWPTGGSACVVARFSCGNRQRSAGLSWSDSFGPSSYYRNPWLLTWSLALGTQFRVEPRDDLVGIVEDDVVLLSPADLELATAKLDVPVERGVPEDDEP